MDYTIFYIVECQDVSLEMSRVSYLRELDDHLDVSRLTSEGSHETLGPFAPLDEPTEPCAIGPREHLRRLVPVSSVRVHATGGDVVLEHAGSTIALKKSCEPGRSTTRPSAKLVRASTSGETGLTDGARQG